MKVRAQMQLGAGRERCERICVDANLGSHHCAHVGRQLKLYKVLASVQRSRDVLGLEMSMSCVCAQAVPCLSLATDTRSL